MDIWQTLSIVSMSGTVLLSIFAATLSLRVRALDRDASLSVHRGADLLDKTTEIRASLTDVPTRITDLEREFKSLRNEWTEHEAITRRHLQRMNKWRQEDNDVAKGGSLSAATLEKVRQAVVQQQQGGNAVNGNPLTDHQVRARLMNG